jgi:hypothetical protein
MTDERRREDAINRRDFLRKGSAVGVGLGIALDASTRASAVGMPAYASLSTSDVVPVPESAIADLRKLLGSGKVLAPNDSDYATTGLPANGMYLKIRPGVIARCANEGDVVKCVQWCQKTGIKPVVRGGGHSYAGLSTTTGLLIDIGDFRSVEVEQDGTAIVGGAARNSDVYNKTKDGKYFLPAGTCPGVAVGGLVLGGGIGYNSRWAGLTCDCLVSTRVVTASGEVLEASANKNTDLFWACRGGAGGSFGINTSFTFKLKEVPSGSIIYFETPSRLRGANLAVKLFVEFNKLMENPESRLNAVARAQAVEPSGGGDLADIDYWSRGQFIGPEDDLRDLLFQSFPLLRSNWKMTEMSFWDAAAKFVNDPAVPHSFGDISRYAAKPVSEDAIGKQIDLITRCPGRATGPIGPSGALWSIGWVGGGKINSIGRTATAYVHRGTMSTLLRPTCSWPNEADQSVGTSLLNWTKEMISLIAKETPNESYQNFPNRLIEDWQQQYYAENLDRLMDVKTKYDGGNLFKNAQSIPPKGV